MCNIVGFAMMHIQLHFSSVLVNLYDNFNFQFDVISKFCLNV